MPRYRFRWELIPQPLLKRLTPDLGSDGDPTEELRRRYGMRPGVEFVRIEWPVLREHWLATDPDARDWVVDRLREARLGAHTAPTTSADTQLTYLRSCRNSARLREIVLAAFLELGDLARASSSPASSSLMHTLTPAEPASPSNIPLRSDHPPTDLDRTVAEAWYAFQTDLQRQMAGLAPDQVVLFELPSPVDPDELAGGAPYLQVIGTDEPRGWFAETSSNHDLDRRVRLDDVQQARLVELGWRPPARTPDNDDLTLGSPNYHLGVVGADGPSRLSDLLTRTIREVFGVPHPSFLTVGGFGLNEADSPDLGLAVPGMSRPTPPSLVEAIVPENPDHLRSLVDEALIPLFGGPPSRDEDGDIPVRSGSAMVFVRVPGDAPVVDLFSPVLLDVDWSAGLLSRLSDLNGSIRFGRLSWSNRTVFASLSLFAQPFVGAHLRNALTLMSELADEVDEQLQQQFGGRVFFGEHSAKGDEGTGGYL